MLELLQFSEVLAVFISASTASIFAPSVVPFPSVDVEGDAEIAAAVLAIIVQLDCDRCSEFLSVFHKDFGFPPSEGIYCLHLCFHNLLTILLVPGGRGGTWSACPRAS